MTKHCNTCDKDLPIEHFAWKNKSSGYRNSTCKGCHKTYRDKHYQANKGKILRQVGDRQAEIRNWFFELRATLHCSRCPEHDSDCLDFHHSDPKVKEFNVSHAAIGGWSKERILDEIKKCEVLCSNCHKKHHARERRAKKSPTKT